jgi:hypothetical protein
VGDPLAWYNSTRVHLAPQLCTIAEHTL